MIADLPPGCEPRCRGCRHRTLLRAESLADKQRFVRAALNCEQTDPIQSVDDPHRWGYRTRSCLHAYWNAEKKVYELGILGAQGLDSEKGEVLPIPRCPLVRSDTRAAEADLRTHLADTGCLGLSTALHAIWVRPDAWLVVLKKNSFAPEGRDFWRTWAEEGARGRAVFVHLNASVGRRSYTSKNWFQVAGTPRPVPLGFEQPLPELHAQATEQANRFLLASPARVAVDLYCGEGAQLRKWLSSGVQGIGVELSRFSVQSAGGDAQILQGRVADRLPQLDQFIVAAGPAFFYANPPRGGLEPAVTQWLRERTELERGAILSCSPRALAKDLSLLVGGQEPSYSVEQIIPYDFFPQTHHVEVLVLLRRSSWSGAYAGAS